MHWDAVGRTVLDGIISLAGDARARRLLDLSFGVHWKRRYGGTCWWVVAPLIASSSFSALNLKLFN